VDAVVLRSVSAKLKGSASLIVAHARDFAKLGAMINFYLDDERLRFEINPAALKRENLQAGSQLLNLAKLVGEFE
jgi:hypothetical protein